MKKKGLKKGEDGSLRSVVPVGSDGTPPVKSQAGIAPPNTKKNKQYIGGVILLLVVVIVVVSSGGNSENNNAGGDPRSELLVCLEGYAPDAKTGWICEDIDECALGAPCGPSKTCVNTAGSYYCEIEKSNEPLECGPGYAPDAATGSICEASFIDRDGSPSDPDGSYTDAERYGSPSDPDGSSNDADGSSNDPDGSSNDADGTSNDADGSSNDADGTSNDGRGAPPSTDREQVGGGPPPVTVAAGGGVCTSDQTAGELISARRFGPGAGLPASQFDSAVKAAFGQAMCSPGDIDGDGVHDLVIGAWQDRAVTGNARGRLFVVLLNEDLSVKRYTEMASGEGINVSKTNGGRIGKSLAGLGDLDGDGVGDFITGEHFDGILHVVFLNSDGTAKKVVTTTGALPSGYNPVGDPDDDFGRDIANVGDLDGDGVVDVAVSAPKTAPDPVFHLLFLNSDGTVKSDVTVTAPAGVGFGSWFGAAIARVGDLDGDGVSELAVGGHTSGVSGAVWIIWLDKAAGWTKKRVQPISATEGMAGGGGIVSMAVHEAFGFGVAETGDINGDGIPDLWVGSFGYRGQTGKSRMLILNADGTVARISEVTPGGLVGTDQFGVTATSIGRVVGGNMAFAIGAMGDDTGGENTGSVYIMKVRVCDHVTSLSSCPADEVPGQVISDGRIGPGAGLPLDIFPEGTMGRLGQEVCTPGDIDNNGVPDLVITAHRAAGGGVNRGSIFVVLLNEDLSVKSYKELSSAGGLEGVTINDDGMLGKGTAALGDLDGDGLGDFIVSLSNPQSLLVVFLSSDGSAKKVVSISGSLPSGYDPVGAGEGFGNGMAGLGDLDGDGVDDVAVGAPNSYPAGIRLLFMKAEGGVKEDVFVSAPEDMTARQAYGSTIAAIGDMDGDGTPELAVGTPKYGDLAGAVFILSLNPEAGWRWKWAKKITGGEGGLAPVSAHGRFSRPVGTGDLNGDGVPDLWVGASFAPDGGEGHMLMLKADGSVLSADKHNSAGGDISFTTGKHNLFAHSGAFLGRMDDGTVAIAVGSIGDSTGGNKAGSVHILKLRACVTVEAEEEGPPIYPTPPTPPPATTDIEEVCTLTHSPDGVSFGRRIGPGAGMPLDIFPDTSGAKLGGSVCSPGDIDGNGVPDLVMGAREDPAGGIKLGSLHVVLLNEDMTVRGYNRLAQGDGLDITDIQAGSRLGISLAALGDFDGDGVGDFIAGTFKRGIMHVVFLNSDGTAKNVIEIKGVLPSGYNPYMAHDAFGYGIANMGDLDGDGVVDIAVTAPNRAVVAGPPVVHLLFLTSDATVKHDVVVTAPVGVVTPGSWFGEAISQVGDLDGDGVPELAVGASRIEDGSVFIIWLDKAAGWTKKQVQIISATQGMAGGGGIVGLGMEGKFGAALAYAGDLNADGVPDLWVGSWKGKDGAGHSRVLMLNADGTVASMAGLVADGVSAPSNFGISGALMGPMCDGRIGFAVGSWGDNTGGVFDGSVYAMKLQVCSGTEFVSHRGRGNAKFVTGEEDKADEECTITQSPDGVSFGKRIGPGAGMPLDLFPEGSGAKLGASVCSPGDIDGNGVPDLVMGAREDPAGGVKFGSLYVVLLNEDMTVRTYNRLAKGDGLAINERHAGSRLGLSLAALGDFDGDGVGDFIAGTFKRGIMHVVFLNSDGTAKSVVEIKGVLPSGYNPYTANDVFGYGIANMGDLDGDGVVDIAVTAPNRAVDAGPPVVHLLFLTPDAGVKDDVVVTAPEGVAAGSWFGEAISQVGDLDGDGVPELAVGADRIAGGTVFIVFLNKATGWTKKRVQPISATEGMMTGGGIQGLASNGKFGAALAYAGDLNADGVPDLWVGSWMGNEGAGNSRVLVLNTDGTVASVAEVVADGVEAPSKFGASGALMGPMCDGRIGFAVGSWGDDTGGGFSGSVYAMKLQVCNDGTKLGSCPVGEVPGQVISDGRIGPGAGLPLDIFPEGTMGRLGQEVCTPGDIDNNGVPDLVITAHRAAGGGVNRGSIFVVLLNEDLSVMSYKELSSAGGLEGVTINDDGMVGRGIAALGDLDGDGVGDFIVSLSNPQSLLVVFLSSDGSAKKVVSISGALPSGYDPVGSGDGPVFGMAGLGDLDGDGVDDVAVGAPHADLPGVRLLFMKVDGSVKEDVFVAAPEGVEKSDTFGSTIARIGDMDGDGIPELAVGSPKDDAGGLRVGAVFVVSLDPEAGWGKKWAHQITGGQGGVDPVGRAGRFSRPVATGDLNGDGVPDLWVGASFAPDGGEGHMLMLNADGSVLSADKHNSAGGDLSFTTVANNLFAHSGTFLGRMDDGTVAIAVGSIGDTTGGGKAGSVHILKLRACDDTTRGGGGKA